MITTKSKVVSKKVLVPATIAVVAVVLTGIFVAYPAITAPLLQYSQQIRLLWAQDMEGNFQISQVR